MNATLGQVGVTIGLAASLLAIGTLAVGLVGHRPRLVRIGRNYVWLVLVGALMAFAFMERALIERDFTVVFVADNGSSQTPALFNVATLWAALEGSIILWALVLAGYLVAVSLKFRRRIDDPLVGWALLTLFVVSAFFFMLLMTVANPFETWSPPAGYDGPGPNPLLQNHVLMAFHPPMLYLGYVGFTVPFAFSIAALVTGRLGEGWLIAVRRWTLASWGFLSIGIILGAWWSYEVLGWGGYWSWDPVENASFLPWLTATAFIHSMMVQERRGILRVWNLSLISATFALTILGTFITRSGVLESVHAFTESGIGQFLLLFFAAIVAVTVGLIAWRADLLGSPTRISAPVSREGAFLANNVLFAGFALIVLLGTVFPLVVEAVNGDQISVGRPYFDRTTMPLGLLLLFLMAIAPVLPWRRAGGELLAGRLQWPAWFATASAVLALLMGATGLAPVVAFGLGGFAAGSALRHLVLAVRRQGARGMLGRANGGMVVHIGIIVIAVALTASSSYLRQAEFTLMPGDTVVFDGYELTYVEAEFSASDATSEVRALVAIDGSGPYAPRVTRFNAAGQTIGSPSVRSTALDDVHLSLLGAPDEDSDEIRLRVTVQPLVVWLWIGGGVVALGTVLSMVPPRRKRGRVTDAVRTEADPAAQPEAAQPGAAEVSGDVEVDGAGTEPERIGAG